MRNLLFAILLVLAVGCQTIKMPDGTVITKPDVETMRELTALVVEYSDDAANIITMIELAGTEAERIRLQARLDRTLTSIDAINTYLERWFPRSEPEEEGETEEDG